MTESFIEEYLIKSIRDAKQEQRESGRGESGRCLSIVITKLQEAQMWYLKSMENEPIVDHDMTGRFA